MTTFDTCKKLEKAINNFKIETDLYNQDKTFEIMNLIEVLCSIKAKINISRIVDQCTICSSENNPKIIHECNYCICESCIVAKLHKNMDESVTNLFKEIQNFQCEKCKKLLPANKINNIITQSNMEKLLKFQESLKSTFICPICYQRQNLDECRMLDCDHKYCITCLEQYLHDKISSNEVSDENLSCMDCHKPISIIIIEKVVKADDWDKLNKFRLRLRNKTKNTSSKFEECPKCGSVMDVENAVKIIHCDNAACKNVFCKHCGYNHKQNITCEQFKINSPQLYENEKKLLEMAQNPDNQFVICPGCQIYLQRNKGCFHMTCRTPVCRGKTEFCFLCRTKYVNSKKMCNCAYN